MLNGQLSSNTTRRRTSSAGFDHRYVKLEDSSAMGAPNQGRQMRGHSDPVGYNAGQERRGSTSSFSKKRRNGAPGCKVWLWVAINIVCFGLLAWGLFFWFSSKPKAPCADQYSSEVPVSYLAELHQVQEQLTQTEKLLMRAEAQLTVKNSRIEELTSSLANSDTDVPETLKSEFQRAQLSLRNALEKNSYLEEKLIKCDGAETNLAKMVHQVDLKEKEIAELRAKLHMYEDGTEPDELTEAPVKAGKKNVSFYRQELLHKERTNKKLQSTIAGLRLQVNALHAAGMAASVAVPEKSLTAANEGSRLRGGDEGRGCTHEDTQRLIARDTLLQTRIARLQEGLQEASRTLARDRYGPGPHRVKIDVEFPAEMTTAAQSRTGSFVVELASLDFMPHTVYYWLTQVEKGIWRGANFIRNARHVIQADPQDAEGHQFVSRFTQGHLPLHVAFQEYDPHFPHIKYTLGLPGRPSGPDWYISVEDNSNAHGPNGQPHFEMPEEADPCFARVVEGFEVVDRMHSVPVRDGSTNDMVYHIRIVDAALMAKNRRLSKVSVAHSSQKLSTEGMKVQQQRLIQEDMKAEKDKAKLTGTTAQDEEDKLRKALLRQKEREKEVEKTRKRSEEFLRKKRQMNREASQPSSTPSRFRNTPNTKQEGVDSEEQLQI